MHLLLHQYNKPNTKRILTTNYSRKSKPSNFSICESIVQSMAVGYDIKFLVLIRVIVTYRCMLKRRWTTSSMRMMRSFARFQIATPGLSCSPLQLNFFETYFTFTYMHNNHCDRVTANLQLIIFIIVIKSQLPQDAPTVATFPCDIAAVLGMAYI